MTYNLIPYTGNKRSVLPQLLPHFPAQITNYWEPFCGTAAIAHALSDRISGRIFLSDTNAELTALLSQIQVDPGRLVRKVYDVMRGAGMPRWDELAVDPGINGPNSEVLSRLKAANENVLAWYNKEGGEEERLFKARFLEIRKDLNSLLRSSRKYGEDSRLTAAATFYIVQRLCASGVYRLNRKGQFNVNLDPNRAIGDPVKLSHWTRLFEDWYPFLNSELEFQEGFLPPASNKKIEIGTFTYNDPHRTPLWAFCDPSSFCLYIDPPYMGCDQSYTQNPWGLSDHESLAAWISAQPCKVLASNSEQARPLYETLPGRIETIHRNARFGGKEILYISP